MIRLREKGQPIFVLMILLTLSISIPFRPALATLIETEVVISPDRIEDTRVLLNQLIARKDVRKTLLAHGINPFEADARVASMTDLEICSIKDQLDKLKPGGEGMLGGNIAPFSTGVALLIIGGIILLIVLFFVLLVKLAPEPSETAKETRLFTPSGGNILQSQPQIDKLQQAEPSLVTEDKPWTGKWKVETYMYSGVWELKQENVLVVSTEQSFVEVEGKVQGNMLSGHLNRKIPFEATISGDGLSFKGEVNKRGISGKKLQ